MILSVFAYELPLAAATRLGPARLATRVGFVVELSGRDGKVGRGEAAPAYWVDGADMDALLNELRAAALAANRDDFEEDPCAIRESNGWSALSPPARHAIECAALDLAAQRRGVSVAELLGGAAHAVLEVSALLGGDTPDVLRTELFALADRGYRVWKLKVGAVGVEDDVRRVHAVGTAMGPTGVLRLDANGAWRQEMAEAVLRACADLPIEFVEEPLRDPDPQALARLRARTGVRIAMDESIRSREDLRRFAPGCDAVVIKLARVGGPSAALGLARQAGDLGLRVVFTDSIETILGRRATLHVAAATATPVAAVGLGGSLMLARDLMGEEAPSSRVVVCGPGLGLVGPLS